MERIVVAAKAGRSALARDAAADSPIRPAPPSPSCRWTGSTSRRSPHARARSSRSWPSAVDGFVERLRAAGVEADGHVRTGLVVPGVLLFAEEQNADVIVCGASTKGRVARRVLGSVPVALISRARRPVLVITPT